MTRGIMRGLRQRWLRWGNTRMRCRLVQQANYAQAEDKLAQGLGEEAGRLFLAAGDYSDASARGNDCIYQAALAAKEAGDYDKATELFTLIIGYLDSEGQIQDCLYQQAAVLRDGGDYTGAIALLEMGGTPAARGRAAALL